MAVDVDSGVGSGVGLTVGTVGLALGLNDEALDVDSGVGLTVGTVGLALNDVANLRPAAADVTAKAAAEVATLTEAKETLPAFKREEAAAW